MDQRILYSNLRGRVSDISLEDFKKFLSNIRFANDGCWEWQGTLNNFGYAQVQFQTVVEGKSWNSYAAHRLSYVIFKGAIPEKADVDHLCYNRACVNPAHLEAVSHKVNSGRAAERRKAIAFVNAFTLGANL